MHARVREWCERGGRTCRVCVHRSRCSWDPREVEVEVVVGSRWKLRWCSWSRCGARGRGQSGGVVVVTVAVAMLVVAGWRS